MNHGINPAELVDLVGHSPRLVQVGEIPDDGGRAPTNEVVHGRQPLGAASVNDDLVPIAEQCLSRGSTEPVSRTGDDDACHGPIAESRSTQPSESDVPRCHEPIRLGSPTRVVLLVGLSVGTIGS